MGFIRLLLSLAVMAYHLVGYGTWGRAALLGFYLMSGYFCTASIAAKGGGWRFLRDRLWRIYPLYLAVFLLSTVWLVLSTPYISGFGADGLSDWIRQLLFLGRIDAPDSTPQELRIIPQAWMLPVMGLWYLAMAAGIGSTAKRAYAWAGLSVLAYVLLRINPIGSDWYFNPLTASLPFAVGSAAYWAGLKLPRDGQWAVWAGAISYPLFLIHYQVGATIPIGRGWPLFFAALPPTLTLSWLLVVAVERPIARYRKTFQSPSKET